MRLKELRDERELTQQHVAHAIQTTQTNIGRWEKGLNEPSSSFLIKLAHFFGVSTDYLLGISDDDAPQCHKIPEITLKADEQKTIDVLRKKTPKDYYEFIRMYAELPSYMQQSIYAELKGMYIGYTVSKNKTPKEN